MKKTLILGIALLAPVLAALAMPGTGQVEFSCGSCSDCTAYLQNGSLPEGGRLIVAGDLASSGDCIDFGGSEDLILDCSGMSLTGDGTGTGIALSTGSNGNTVRNCINVSYFGTGISVVSSDSAVIENCGVYGNGNAGISFFTSSGSDIMDTNASSNPVGLLGSPLSDSALSGLNCSYNSVAGIRLRTLGGNDVSDTLLIGNLRGMEIVSSSGNTVSGLMAQGGSVGLYMRNTSESNTVSGSVFIGQSGSSLELDSGNTYVSGNLFYDNIFNSSVNFLSDDSVNNVNQWNTTLDCSAESIIGGECLGGNYWASPEGSGFSDTCSATESWVCSSSFAPDEANIDWLPLARYSQPPDTKPPLIKLESPTPDEGEAVSLEWVFVNASGSEGLDSCILDWNRTNMSMQASGATCWLNVTMLSEGEITFRVYGNDSSGNMNASEERVITITEQADSRAPVIEDCSVPMFAEPWSTAMMGINASDETALDSLWAVITGAGGSERLELVNNQEAGWNASITGLLNLTFYANDTSGNLASASRMMLVNESVNLSVSFQDPEGVGLGADWSLRLSGQGFLADQGNGEEAIEAGLIAGIYDLMMEAFGGDLNITITEAILYQGLNGSLTLEHTSGEGYGDIFAIECPLEFDNATIRIDYSDMGYTNEDSLTVYVCEEWNMTEGQCDGDWEQASDVENYDEDDLLMVEVSGFSAFGLSEGDYCGDGECGAGEDPGSCPEDCTCEEGDTRPCSQEHEGVCSEGTETCIENEWTGCPAPSTEVCNQLDDDCDGVVDDVGGGSSVSSTQCQCFNGRSPLTETCNGVDDDCDGRIDEGSDCCTSGETRECGPSTTTGQCSRGTVTCEDNVWGECQGAVYPEEEVCGDGLDNDCDGGVDEGCEFPDCPHGEITESCVCGGITENSGYCCSGRYSTEECKDSPWSLLILAGVIILVVLAVLVIIFRKEGRELTWEELRNKYGSRQPPGKESTEEWT